MNNFRNEPRRQRRQAMDGILNAPARPQLQGREPVRGTQGDSFQKTPRTIGDFKRPGGYHMANSPVMSSAQGQRMQHEADSVGGDSLLHTTLPVGKSFGETNKKDKRRNRHNKTGKHRIRRRIIRTSLVVLALLILVGGFLFAKGYIKLHKVFKGGGSAAALKENVNPSLLKGEGDGRVNIMLLGRGGEGHDGADLTDTMLIASIDPVNNKAALVSLPRDFWVTNASGDSSKVNAVFANAKSRAMLKTKDKKQAEAAGIEAAKKEMSTVLGLPIHYYSIVDFTAFRQAVDTVGGVDINITDKTAVKEKLWDEMTRKNYVLDVEPGMQHFDGQRALFFTRSRHTSARGDFDRAERQRVFIEALTQKVASAKTYTNPVKVSQLMDAFGNHVSTDMSLDDAMRLLQIGRKIGNHYDSVDLADPAKPLVKTGMISGQSVVMPAAGAENYGDIQLLVRSRLRDGYLAKENATVNILNGTDIPGLATKKADELRSYGYNVGTVSAAPTSNYENTTIVDLSTGNNKKPYTKNYLEKRFGVKATTKLPDSTIQSGGANFVIILGQNETTNN